MNATQRLFWTIALACMWSPSFLFIKLAIGELSPLLITSCRVSIATILLSLLLVYYRRPLPTQMMFWVHSTIMAIVASALPFCLFCFAEQSIESALAAILNGSSPMFTAILAHLFIPSDRFNAQKICGVMLSVTGLIVLFLPNLMNGLEGTVVGMSAALLASLCYAVSHVYAKKFLVKQAAFVSPTAQLLCSACLLWPLVILFDWSAIPSTMPSLHAIGGVCGLALFGTFFAFIIYFKLIESCGPTAISTVACFFPVGGMILGFLFLGEAFTTLGMVAAAMIFCGLLFVNEVVSLKLLRRAQA
jgi:drug/metabolite transporter (DMT)-like permease